MAIISADGLFYGDRLAACSDLAHLWWPFFYHASNDYARLEISYEEFKETAMRSFRQKLSKREFLAIIQEYQANHLLFLYRVGSSMWGQWDTEDDKLPRYKSASSRRSPAPPLAEFKSWQEEYKKQKADSEMFEVLVNVPDSSSVSSEKTLENSETFQNISKTSETFQNVSKHCETFQNISHGIGIGVGVGVGIGIGEATPKRVAVALAVSDPDAVVREIAYTHPGCEHLAQGQLDIPGNLERAIFGAVEKSGRDLVLAGTQNLRDAVSKWNDDDKRFIPNPLKFYREAEYLKDPIVWKRDCRPELVRPPSAPSGRPEW